MKTTLISNPYLVVWEMPLKETFNSEVEVPNVVGPISAKGSCPLRSHLKRRSSRFLHNLYSSKSLKSYVESLNLNLQNMAGLSEADFDNRLWEKSPICSCAVVRD